MIKRITVGHFQLKEKDTGTQLHLRSKPIYPITNEVGWLREKDKQRIAEVASWITTYSPFAQQISLQYMSEQQKLDAQLQLIYEELERLNLVIEHANELIATSLLTAKIKYTSIHMVYDSKTKLPVMHVHYLDALPASRAKLTRGHTYGIVLVFNTEPIKYINLEDPTDLYKLYGKYLLVAKP